MQLLSEFFLLRDKMIERFELEKINFEKISVEDRKDFIGLKEAYDKIFPLFERAYELSKKFDSRSRFEEDEDYINIRIEIGNILLKLRKTHKIKGFDKGDRAFSEELFKKWGELSKGFPVFGGKVENLFIFWFLSYLAFIQFGAFLRFKMNSMVNLFFFEEIIDYIVYDGYDVEVGEEILEKFTRFKAPIDHYTALNLILRNIKIKEKGVREKLFEFLDGLFNNLKTKIPLVNLILDKIYNLLYQDEFEKAGNVILKNFNLLLKEKPVETLRLMWKVYFEYGDNRFRDYFEDVLLVKKIFSLVPTADVYRAASIMFSEFEITDDEILNYLEEKMDLFETNALENRDYTFVLKRRWGYLKREEFYKVEEFIKNYEDTFIKEIPFDYLQLYINYLKRKDEKELSKRFNDRKYVLNLLSNIKSPYLKAKTSLLILSEVKIEDEDLRDKLFSLGSFLEDKTEFLRLEIMSLINQKEFSALKEYIFKLKTNIEIFSPSEFLNTIFLISQEFELGKEFFNENVVNYLIKGLEFVSEREVVKYLFVWEVIKILGFSQKHINEFLKKLEENVHSNLYLENEKNLLKEYLRKRKEILSMKHLTVEKLKKYSFSEFAGDLFEKDLRERIHLKRNSVSPDQLIPELELILMRAPGDVDF